jgi:hypothetical protein
MKQFFSHPFIVRLGFVFSMTLYVLAGPAIQDDPVSAPDLSYPPLIDGSGDDACWANIPWQDIDQVWIPWGGSVALSDFSGRYKIAWSSSSNLLYFLVEVNDDVLVDGFQPGRTADVYNYDIIEVFIDEDHSGGLHIFDGVGNDVQQYGSNGENAFAYHMYCSFPEEGKTAKSLYVGDLAGVSWSNYYGPNYAGHFPEFAMQVTDSGVIREFSLIVYNDTYESDHTAEARVTLTEGKEIGLSLAYCDNDDPDENPKTRDNFYGSVEVPESKYNDHWMDAGDFGHVKLAGPSTSVENQKIRYGMDLYPNPASSHLTIEVNNGYRGNVVLRLYNILGQRVLQTIVSKNGPFLRNMLLLPQLPRGLYFLEMQSGLDVAKSKLILR